MTQEEKQKLLDFRQWLITMTEKWQNESKDHTNSPCGTHYDRGNADGFIRARAKFETLFDFLNEY